MKSYRALRVIKKKYIFIIIFLIAIVAVNYEINNMEQRDRLIVIEVQRVNKYFNKKGYSINEIPPWLSLAPCQVDVQRLRYTSYLLQTDECKNTTVGFYYYPFAYRGQAERYYKRLSDKDKEQFYLISSSLIFVGEPSVGKMELFGDADAYFLNLKE